MPLDMGSISTLVSSLQSAVEIAKVMKGLHDETLIQSKVIELNGAIVSAQSSALAAQADQFALLERVRNLEKQIAEMEDWHTEKQRHELKQIDHGAFAYVVKPEMRGAEPPYWACAACFENRKRRILQFQGRAKDGRGHVYKCPGCSTEIRVQYDTAPDAPRRD